VDPPEADSPDPDSQAVISKAELRKIAVPAEKRPRNVRLLMFFSSQGELPFPSPSSDGRRLGAPFATSPETNTKPIATPDGIRLILYGLRIGKRVRL
jgi:hypothetical protein